MTPNSAKSFYTIVEAADILRLTYRSVWQLCKDGKIPATKPAGTWLIPIDAFDEWVAAGSNSAVSA